MSGWEELLSKKTPDKPATILDERPKESLVKKETIDDMVEKSTNIDVDIWKRLGLIDAYNSGRMFGACEGPDSVSVRDFLDKMSSMISDIVVDAYIKADKPANKDVIEVFRSACKAMSSLDCLDVSVNKPRLLAAIHGFSDSYVKTADPEAVRNISMQ